MKIVTVVGARPQFIKAASVSRVLRKKHTEILVHTGQHYDSEMSEVFFNELEIPKPDINLGVGSKSHARQTAEMLVKLEEVFLKERPDTVLIYGDTNSTLSAALAAGKLNIPIAHVEAGGRTFIKDMPEEQNRIVADHLAKWNFAPSETALSYLHNEGIIENAYNVGDVMFDGLLYYLQIAEKQEANYYHTKLKLLFSDQRVSSVSDEWYLATIHRPENTDSIELFKNILDGLQELDSPVIFPAHPRVQKLIQSLKQTCSYDNIFFVHPLGYIDMLFFAKHAIKIITDSGGLHKEAYLMGVPGVVILRGTGWEETLQGNCNVLAKPDKNDIIDKVINTNVDNRFFGKNYYGDGTASQRITEILENYDKEELAQL